MSISPACAGKSFLNNSERKVSVAEKFKLKIGETITLKNGVRLKIQDTEFESKQITKPGISAPATSRFTIILEASQGGVTEKLFFVPSSPGTVSMEENVFQNVTVRYLGHTYDSKQVLIVEFSAE
jgi:hypothetical protein